MFRLLRHCPVVVIVIDRRGRRHWHLLLLLMLLEYGELITGLGLIEHVLSRLGQDDPAATLQRIRNDRRVRILIRHLDSDVLQDPQCVRISRF